MFSPESRSPYYEIAGRTGLSARAIVYALIAGLMLRAVFLGGENDGVSPGDAFNWLETSWPGKAMLIVLGTGLLAYAGWRLTQGFLDMPGKGDDAMGRTARLGMIMSGLGYGLVGLGAFGVLLGQNDGGGPGATQSTVQWLLGQPFGRWLIMTLGLVFAGVGSAQIWRALDGSWKDSLDLSGPAGLLTPVVGFAIIGRGLLFLVLALFVVIAGWQASPEEAKGLSATITWLRDQPYGLALYLGSALVLAGYAVYSGLQARCMRLSEHCAGSSRPAT
ncbi:DUF1206 domain-containing protein [Marinicauda pacifica]|uniref:DUF1206 domain-containing protein n=1 Tax=Marinicauda pacifica TaxID=1133559 RepID=UPI0035C7E44D